MEREALGHSGTQSSQLFRQKERGNSHERKMVTRRFIVWVSDKAREKWSQLDTSLQCFSLTIICRIIDTIILKGKTDIATWVFIDPPLPLGDPLQMSISMCIFLLVNHFSLVKYFIALKTY